MFDALASLLVHDALGLAPASRIGAALHFFVMDAAKIFFMLAAVIYVMGLARALLSREKVRDYVRGRPKWLARLSAIGLGAVTPFCSCSSVPLFIGFVEAGIPLGVIFSFLIASPMINEVRWSSWPASWAGRRPCCTWRRASASAPCSTATRRRAG